MFHFQPTTVNVKFSFESPLWIHRTNSTYFWIELNGAECVQFSRDLQWEIYPEDLRYPDRDPRVESVFVWTRLNLGTHSSVVTWYVRFEGLRSKSHLQDSQEKPKIHQWHTERETKRLYQMRETGFSKIIHNINLKLMFGYKYLIFSLNSTEIVEEKYVSTAIRGNIPKFRHNWKC